MSPVLATLAPFRFVQRVQKVGDKRCWQAVPATRSFTGLVDDGYPLASWIFDPVDLAPHEQERLAGYLAGGVGDLDEPQKADRYALLDRCRKGGGWFGAIDLDAREGTEQHLDVAVKHARVLDAELAKQGFRLSWYQTNARGGLHADLLLPPSTQHVHLPRGFLKILKRVAAAARIPTLEEYPAKKERPPIVLDTERLARGGATTVFRLPGAAKGPGGFKKTPFDLANAALLERHAVLPYSDPAALLAACEEVAAEFRDRLARGLPAGGHREVAVHVTAHVPADPADLAWLEAADPSTFRAYVKPHEEAGRRHAREFGLACRLMRLGADDERVARLLRSKPGGVIILDGERKLARTVGQARARYLDVPSDRRAPSEDHAPPPEKTPELDALERRALAWIALKRDLDDHPYLASPRLRALVTRIANCCESLLKFRCPDGHVDRVAPNACGSPLCPACHHRKAAPQLAYLEAALGVSRCLDALVWVNPAPDGDVRSERAALRHAEAALKRSGVHREGPRPQYLKVAGIRRVVYLRNADGYAAEKLAKRPDLVTLGWTLRENLPGKEVQRLVGEVYAEPSAELQRLLAARDEAGTLSYLLGRGAHVVRVSMSRPTGHPEEIPWLAETRRRADGKAAAAARRAALGEGPWDPTICHHRVVGPDGKGCACGKLLTPTAYDRKGEVLARGVAGGKGWPVTARAFAVLAARRALADMAVP